MGGASAGALGAAFGLALGILHFWITGSRTGKTTKGAPDELAPEARAAFNRQVAFVRRLLFWSTVMIYPVLGYALGRALGSR